jgi:hypothetical protein
MPRKPSYASWVGFTKEQNQLLDFIDDHGNNGWAPNSQTEDLMPTVMDNIEQFGMSLDQVKNAMWSIGYTRADLDQLDQWESKRTTGRFGP